MLILSPSGFFNSPAEIKSDKDWKITLGQKSQKGAELLIIIYALRKVEERWRQFNEYIGSLLVEDFMNPTAYLNLLFEDKNFSYSKLYFWAIGCLNEFTVSIEDNIKQLQLFRKERIPHPSSKSPALPQELLSLDEEAGKIAQSLEDIRAQFKAKSVTIQALRDGVSGLPLDLLRVDKLTSLLAFQCHSCQRSVAEY
ncbi:hypothetical protein N431DRAFT_101888 [Stipitochalara longipes BDJ]|nr:hypothetical protein N431DRAFT_101888 [Stipitochalara longipes BDJ]